MSDLARVLADHRHGQAFMKDFLARNPTHPTEARIVDDRTFLLGLDELYRTGIKPHERTELTIGTIRRGPDPPPMAQRRQRAG